MQLLSEQDSIFASGLADAAAEDENDSRPNVRGKCGHLLVAGDNVCRPY